MSSGIIYLYQPIEFSNSKKYKIGCSKKSISDKIIHSNDRKYIFISECYNHKKIKSEIINKFLVKFEYDNSVNYFISQETRILYYFTKYMYKLLNIYYKPKKIKTY